MFVKLLFGILKVVKNKTKDPYTHTHTHTHIYTHTYTHTHIYTYINRGLSNYLLGWPEFVQIFL